MPLGSSLHDQCVLIDIQHRIDHAAVSGMLSCRLQPSGSLWTQLPRSGSLLNSAQIPFSSPRTGNSPTALGQQNKTCVICSPTLLDHCPSYFDITNLENVMYLFICLLFYEVNQSLSPHLWKNIFKVCFLFLLSLHCDQRILFVMWNLNFFCDQIHDQFQ